MDVRNNTTTSNGGLNQGIKLLVTSDSQLNVARRDSLSLKIFASITCEFQNLSGQILENGSSVDSGSGSDTAIGLYSALQESVDSSDRELRKRK